jgi:phosphoribosyl-AMP cyclohydrolase
MPAAAKLMTSDDPPALMNGSVIPVIGTRATTTAMLMNAWMQSHAVMPMASRAPKVSGAASAVRIPA